MMGIEGAQSIDWKSAAMSINTTVTEAKILWKYLAYGEVWTQSDVQNYADLFDYDSEPESYYMHPNEAVRRLRREIPNNGKELHREPQSSLRPSESPALSPSCGPGTGPGASVPADEDAKTDSRGKSVTSLLRPRPQNSNMQYQRQVHLSVPKKIREQACTAPLAFVNSLPTVMKKQPLLAYIPEVFRRSIAQQKQSPKKVAKKTTAGEAAMKKKSELEKKTAAIKATAREKKAAEKAAQIAAAIEKRTLIEKKAAKLADDVIADLAMKRKTEKKTAKLADDVIADQAIKRKTEKEMEAERQKKETTKKDLQAKLKEMKKLAKANSKNRREEEDCSSSSGSSWTSSSLDSSIDSSDSDDTEYESEKRSTKKKPAMAKGTNSANNGPSVEEPAQKKFKLTQWRNDDENDDLI